MRDLKSYIFVHTLSAMHVMLCFVKTMHAVSCCCNCNDESESYYT